MRPLFALAAAAAAAFAVTAHAAPAPVTVALGDFTIKSPAKLAAGKVTLNVVNRGKAPHALRVAGPGVSAKTAVIAAGKSARLTVTLRAGAYTLSCPVGNHAARGMRASLQVGATGAAPAPPVATTPASTTPSGGYDGY